MKNHLHNINEYFETSRINVFFVLSFFVVFLSVFFKFPSLSYHSELWAEAGTNYLYNALNNDFLSSLNVSDYGYFPLLPRLFSWIFVNLLGIRESFPIVAQLTGIFFIAFCAAFINLTIFQTLIPNNPARFILSLTVGLADDYELYTFINFSYFGCIICFLIIFIDKEKISLPFYISILSLAFLILCSKAVFIIFLPLYGCFLLYHLYNKNKREIICHAVLAIGAAVQILFIYFHMAPANPGGQVKMNIGLLTDKILYSVWTLILTFFSRKTYPQLIEIQGLNLGVMILLIILIGFIVYAFFKTGKWFQAIFIVSAVYIMVASAALNLMAFNTFYGGQNYTSDWSVFYPVPFFRWTYMPLVIAILGFSVLVLTYIRYKIIATLIVAYLCWQSIELFYNEKDLYPTELSHSHWQLYKYQLEKEAYYIPVNPAFPWALQKNTSVAKISNIYTPSLSNKNVFAVLLLNNEKNLPADLSITAYDSLNRAVTPKKINDANDISVYFYFDKEIKVEKLEYHYEKKPGFVLDTSNVIIVVNDLNRK